MEKLFAGLHLGTKNFTSLHGLASNRLVADEAHQIFPSSNPSYHTQVMILSIKGFEVVKKKP